MVLKTMLVHRFLLRFWETLNPFLVQQGIEDYSEIIFIVFIIFKNEVKESYISNSSCNSVASNHTCLNFPPKFKRRLSSILIQFLSAPPSFALAETSPTPEGVEQYRSDPQYLEYYYSNKSLNPR